MRVLCLLNGSLRTSREHIQDRLRESIPTFVLVSDGYDAELAASLQESGGFLLGRPLQEPELERVLSAVEARAGSRA